MVNLKVVQKPPAQEGHGFVHASFKDLGTKVKVFCLIETIEYYGLFFSCFKMVTNFAFTVQNWKGHHKLSSG